MGRCERQGARILEARARIRPKKPEGSALGKVSFEAFDFSVVTMAMVGYADIDPTSRRAQVVVMRQILTGLIDAVVVFSIALNSTRRRESW